MNKNNIPSLIIRRNLEIDVLEMSCAKHRVITSTREVIRDGKWPTVLAHVRAHDGDIDEVLQALQSTRDKRAVGPWASVGDVEVVPPCPNNNISSVPQNSRVKSGKWGGGHTFLGLVFASLGNSISKGAGAPIERAIAILGVARKRLGDI